MKLDSEYTYHHPYPNDHIPKVLVHNGNHFIFPKDNHFMVDMLDIDETSKEGIHGVESPNEYDSCKVILPPKQHGIPNMERFIKNNNNEYDIMRSSYNGSNREIGLVVKEDYYANKAVAKVEASEEMAVCVSDGSCHRVENISEVVHSFQSSFVEKQELGREASFSSNKSSNNDLNISMYSAESCSCVSTIEGGDDLDTPELVKCIVSEGGDKLDTVELVECNVLEGGCKPETNDLIASDSSDKVIETELPASEEIEKNPLQVNSSGLGLQVDSSSLDCSDDNRQSIGIFDEVTEKCLLSSEELNNDSLQVDLSSLGRSGDQKQSMDILDEVTEKQLLPSEELNRDLLQVDSSSLGCSGDQKQPIDRSQNDQAHIGPGIEAACSDGATTSTRRSLHSLIHGDSNLTGPGFLSGPTANSGHIQYSGSISVRSDSSTTSARSFAFPILHSEWNSSPVKMAKATRRRGWRTGLLCCRF